ncbi:hypothetical protein PHYC_00705 [Phycisphaerales bacterium]|nr:hypothetical protein PHYC_00705 [Phycisphaerales bacterium]
MPSSRRAFTLMELLVVIGIIGVLVAVTIVVGSAVTSNARSQLTADGLRVMDNALAAYITDVGDTPAAYVEDPRATQDPARPNPLIPVADARNMSDTHPGSPAGNQMINSVGLFMSQVNPISGQDSVTKAKSSSQAKAALDALPSRLSSMFDPDPTAGGSDRHPPLTTALDAWGRPLRYVHPAFDGLLIDNPANANPNPDSPRDMQDVIQNPYPNATAWAISAIRRNGSTTTAPGARSAAEMFPDSDGGTCTGNRPYFYSAGPDGLVGVYLGNGGNILADYNKDNVYTTRPSLPAKYN